MNGVVIFSRNPPSRKALRCVTGRTFCRLPDLSQMQVKVRVHETKVEALQPGMRARINIQGRNHQGEVVSIANQPEASGWWAGNVKEYATIVKIEGQPDGLRPGMTAEAEILVAHLKNALTLPVATVVERRGQYLCWVKTPQGAIKRRPLILGQSNDQFVEVQEGIAEGDLVIHNPRTFVEEARAVETETEETPDVKARFGDVSPAGATAANESRGPGAGPGGPPNAEGPGGGGPRGAAPGAMPDLLSFDKDGDSKVSKDEAPAPMRPMFDQLDGNKDGFLDKDEIDELARRARAMAAGAGPGGGPPDLMESDADKDGKVSKDEAPEWMQSFFDKVDANSDGFIDKAEVQQMRSRMRAGAGGGPPGQGPGGRAGGPEGGTRGAGRGGAVRVGRSPDLQ